MYQFQCYGADRMNGCIKITCTGVEFIALLHPHTSIRHSQLSQFTGTVVSQTLTTIESKQQEGTSFTGWSCCQEAKVGTFLSVRI